MWPDRVSNPGPLTYESDALTTVLRGPALRSLGLYRGERVKMGNPQPHLRNVLGKHT